MHESPLFKDERCSSGKIKLLLYSNHDNYFHPHTYNVYIIYNKHKNDFKLVVDFYNKF